MAHRGGGKAPPRDPQCLEEGEPMAQSARFLEERDLLREYLRGLQRHPRASQDVAPGWQMRTCAACGEEAAFRLDHEGDWATCGRCGHLA